MTLAQPLHIVAACWEHVDVTRRFLRSLARESAHPWTLWLVDNGSSDQTRHLQNELATLVPGLDVRILRQEKNLGCSRAWNIGIHAARQAGARFIGVLNNDLVFAPGWDRALVDRWRARGELALCPSVDDGPPGGFAERAVTFMRRNADRTRLKMQSECVFFDVTIFDKIGFYDERFFVGYEDFDFFVRLDLAGIPVLSLGGSRVWHQEKSTRKSLPSAHEAEGQALFVEKWGEALLRHPGFAVPGRKRRWWKWRNAFGLY